jgi:cytoskeleton protein RodZ
VPQKVRAGGRKPPAPSPASVDPYDPNVPLGTALHATRRRRRVSMDRAVVETKIRRDYITSMERNDFSFQAPVYVRGFLANYARFLRLDPGPLLAKFDDIYGAPPNEALVLAEQNATWSGAVPMPSAFRPLAITAALLLVLTTATLWTRAGDEARPPRDDVRTEAATDEVETDAADAEQPVDRRERKAAESSAARSDGRLDVRIAATTARSWVEVTSGDEVLFMGTLEVGDEQVIRSKGGVRITLGFPAGVELTVDGERLGSPGGEDVLEFALPDDLAALT